MRLRPVGSGFEESRFGIVGIAINLPDTEGVAIVDIALRPGIDEVHCGLAERIAERIEFVRQAVDEFASVGAGPVRGNLCIPVHPWHSEPFPDLVILDIEVDVDIAFEPIVEKRLEIGFRIDGAAIFEIDFRPRIVSLGGNSRWDNPD